MATERIFGLSGSGMDVDSMVAKLMVAKRKPYDKLYQTKTRTEWKKTAYNDVYKQLSDFRNEMFDYKLQSTLNPKKVGVTNTGGTSNTTTVLSATANADAANVSHSVKVTQLAQSASMTSTEKINLAADEKKKLSTILGTISGDLNLTIADGSTSKDEDGNVIQNTKTITYTEEELADKTIYDLISDINKSGLNIKASYDEKLDRVFLYNSKSGEESKVELKGEAADGTSSAMGAALVNGLKVSTTGSASTNDTDPTKPVLDASGNPVLNPDGTPKYEDKFVRGKNAEAIIDGVAVSEESNNFTVAGVSYSLQNLGEARVQIDSDIDAQIDTVKKFVESYNKLLTSLNDTVAEKYYRDYAPLTDEQKKEMSESQIKQWEEKSKSGMLNNDPDLKQLINKMRNAMSSAVSGLSGDYVGLSGLGITTNYQEKGGKLYIDEKKLKKALQDDPDVLTKVFSTTGSDEKSSNDDGVVVRLYDSMTKSMSTLSRTAGTAMNATTDTQSTMAKQLTRYTEQMKTLNKKLTAWENSYYKKFTQMEVTLSKLSNQMNSLASMFGTSG